MNGSGTKTPALEVRGLVKSYGSLKALDDVSLAVAGGEFVGLANYAKLLGSPTPCFRS